MLAIASGGLVANLAGLWLLHEHKDHSLNTHAAWLHVLSDALGSAGAIASACLILAFGWTWADPVASIIIGLLVIRASWSLVKETVGVLMEDAPGHIDVDDVRRAMLEVEGVRDVRDLHVWSITSGLESLSAHVFVDDAGAHHRVLCATREMLCERFGIEHVTIQVELREELAGS